MSSASKAFRRNNTLRAFKETIEKLRQQGRASREAFLAKYADHDGYQAMIQDEEYTAAVEAMNAANAEYDATVDPLNCRDRLYEDLIDDEKRVVDDARAKQTAVEIETRRILWELARDYGVHPLPKESPPAITSTAPTRPEQQGISHEGGKVFRVPESPDPIVIPNQNDANVLISVIKAGGVIATQFELETKSGCENAGRRFRSVKNNYPLLGKYMKSPGKKGANTGYQVKIMSKPKT